MIVNSFLRKYYGMYLRLIPLMRPAISYIKDNLKGGLIGVEIGVLDGHNALNILQNLNIKKLYLIDPWIRYEGYIDGEGIYKPFDEYYEYTLNLLRKYKDKIVVIKNFSENCLKLIPDNLDFVYIDGNHNYEYVKKDLENYYPKIKKGGVLAGHDFESFIEGRQVGGDGVVKAVLEFVNKNNLLPLIHHPDWWICK